MLIPLVLRPASHRPIFRRVPLTVLLLLPLLFALPQRVAAQINVPHVAVSGAPILASHFNANMSALGSNACNRENCIMTGAMQGTSATFSSTMLIQGATSLQSSLAVNGATTLSGALTTTTITAAGNVAPITGASYALGGAATRWLTVFTGALDASGDVLDSTGNLTLNDAVDISGAVTLSSTLTTNGNTNGGINHDLSNTSTGTSALIALRLVNNTGVAGFIQLTGGNFTGFPSDLALVNAVSGSKLRLVTTGTGPIELSSGPSTATLSNTAFSATVPFAAAVGSVSAPTFSFTGDTDTGLFRAVADGIGFAVGGTERLRVRTGLNTVALVAAPLGTGAVAGPNLLIEFNSSGNGAAGTLGLSNRTGSNSYLWVNAGLLRIGGSQPREDDGTSHTSGTVVGDQTSSLDSKQNVVLHEDFAGDLQKVLAAPLYTWTYKDGRYNGESFLGYVTDVTEWAGKDADAQHPNGRSLDEGSVLGVHAGAIKALAAKVEALEKRVAQLQARAKWGQ